MLSGFYHFDFPILLLLFLGGGDKLNLFDVSICVEIKMQFLPIFSFFEGWGGGLSNIFCL